MMQPVLIELSKRMVDRVRILKIDGDKNPAVAQEYQIQGVPTFMVFRSGKVLWKQSGALSIHQLEQVITRFENIEK
jgi:thioredoxin 1